MESINEIAIKLSVHAEGVSAGFRTAAEEARGFQKEIDRFAYAVDKGLNRNFGPMLDAALNAQFTKDTEERLAREKKAQEDFNTWYRKEMEQEVAAYTAAEAAKEEATQARIAAERQAALYTHNMQQLATARPLPTETEARGQELLNLEQAIRARYALMDQEQQRTQNQIAMNTTNAQRFQAVLEMETAARAQANNDLRAAITARYALLEQDERALRDNASNRAAAQARVTAAAQQAHQQDLDNLRDYITQKYAILNREEAIEKMNASNAAEIARMRTLQSEQAAARANAQRDSDFAAYKADLARQEAAGMVNAERTARIERARQLDAKRAADDDRVRQLNDWRMQQALMQRAAVDTQLTVARMGGGFGGAAMAMGQLSYAAEDLIQVLAMGGGLNMALMSASNNLSMVARALIGTSGVMSAVAGFAIPALLIGTGILIQYLLREEDQVDAVTKAYKRLHDELEHTQELLSRQMQHRFNMQDIDDLTTYSAALAKLRQEIRELAEEEAKAAALEEKIAATRKEIRDMVAGGTIIADAQKVADMMAQSAGVHGADAIAAAKKDVRDLTEAYQDLAETMATGTPDEIVRAAEEMKRVIEGTSEVFKLEFLSGEQAAKLSAILGTDDEVTKLQALRELMLDLSIINGDIANGSDAIARAQENTNRLLRQENQLRQDNIRFQLSATEAQRESIDIQNQLSQFLGVDNPNPMIGMDPNDFSAEQVRQSAEFLELMWRDLERQKQEILDEQQRVTPIGGMEQNPFQAQADAFKQMLDAQFRQEDPQLAELIRRQGRTNDILEAMTGIRVIE